MFETEAAMDGDRQQASSSALAILCKYLHTCRPIYCLLQIPITCIFVANNILWSENNMCRLYNKHKKDPTLKDAYFH